MRRQFLLRCLTAFSILTIWTGGFAQFEPPAPKYKLGFVERTRFVTFNNPIDLDDNIDTGSTFTRHRSNFIAQWMPGPAWELGVKITNEFRYYFHPDGRDFNIHEFFFDQLYFQGKRPGGLPFSFKIGRQNINLGEGFLVMDGHPLDGSRSIYFNAARVDLHFRGNNDLILFASHQPRTDDMLPVVNDLEKSLTEQIERGIGAYYMGQIGEHSLHAYYLRKDTKANPAWPDQMSINALGTRFTAKLAHDLSLTAEGTFQIGKVGSVDQTAFGGYFHLDHQSGWDVLLPISMTFGGIYLSGDDPDTKKLEAWDPLFSRWPKWSYSLLYLLMRENGNRVGYWSNFASLYGSAVINIAPRVQGTFTYHRLYAPQFSDAGTDYLGLRNHTRGELFITKVTFRINKYISGHLLWDVFRPGSYYRKGADGYNYFHFQIDNAF